MKPRTPTFLWIPFVFSVGTISWALLVAGLAVLAAVVLTPAIQDVKDAQTTRNDYQATLDLLDQKIAMQKDFVAAAATEPMLMERLASRQLHLEKPGEQTLILDPAAPYQDRSVESLLAESLTPTTPRKVEPLPAVLAMTQKRDVRSVLVILACGALVLSFLLGVRYDRA
ncbi:MAG TPA: hypothetical protein VHQ47_05920 [Phycisphaerae bacterium]|jgi:hypothetical protein|nr:hypothetical protein [Phycisphaerae bacterium]